MKPETQEWVEKAEGDLKVARREGQTIDPMLSEIYHWFTEGFDTKDLQEAKALLEELSHCVIGRLSD